MKTLFVVSGGDAPGINNVLWHYTTLAYLEPVVGAQGGFPGVIDGHLVPLNAQDLARHCTLAGSYLMSSREAVLAGEGAREKLLRVIERERINGVVLFGGNGTLHHVLPLLVEWGIPCIGLPTTIDNDVPGTDYTLGFDSACNYAYQAVDGVRATAYALPGRIFTIETLGGNTGFIALAVAYASGAHAVLVPEYPYGEDWLAQRMRDAVEADGYGLVVLSEGVTIARSIAVDLAAMAGIRVRDTRLGHAQRGGTPTHLDRTAAANMARIAFRALRDGVKHGVVVMRGGEWTLHEGTLRGFVPPLPDRKLYNLINGLE